MDNDIPQGTETILLVDEEESFRLGTARILERHGYKVLQAATANQALHLATLSNAHLLLVHVVLPQTSGSGLAHEISALRPGIHFLYYSAHTAEDVLDDRTEQRPGAGFIQTPFSAVDLATKVREILDTPLPIQDEEKPSLEGSESILVVDDDAQVRRFMTRALGRLQYHVLEAHYPDRALSIARNSRVDLVVMDVVMPQMTGPELARAIAEFKPQVRYLYVSGMALQELALERNPGEAKARFLQKPFTRSELGKAVRAALDAPPRN